MTKVTCCAHNNNNNKRSLLTINLIKRVQFIFLLGRELKDENIYMIGIKNKIRQYDMQYYGGTKEPTTRPLHVIFDLTFRVGVLLMRNHKTLGIVIKLWSYVKNIAATSAVVEKPAGCSTYHEAAQ